MTSTVKSSFVWFGQGGDPGPPPHVTVEGAGAAQVRASLARRLGLPDAEGRDVDLAMLARSERVADLEEGAVFDLGALLGERSLPAPGHVLLSWDPLSTFFKVGFNDLLSALPFLFELEVYDLLILDDDLEWGVYLLHHGEARFVRLQATDVP